MLSQYEKKLLLWYSRAVLVEKLKGVIVPEKLQVKIDATEVFKESRGVFVSLHLDGDLRGCIGYIEPIKPLAEAVQDNSVNAAFRDPRFQPLNSDELEDIDIEISVLTVPKPIDSYERFEVGKHGIILKKGSRQAVFLPQVAPEQGWDRETTLKYLSHKAGLPVDAWKEGCEFLVFEAEHFSEQEIFPPETEIDR